MSLFHIVFTLFWTSGSWFVWKRYRDRLFSRLFFIGLVTFLIGLWDYFAENHLSLSTEMLLVNKKILSYVDLATIASILVVVILSWMNKTGSNDNK